MIVKKQRFFPPWREAEHQQWLQQMSREGLHLLDLDWLGRHSFISGPPEDWVYRWSPLPNREREHYKQLYRDAGWEIAAVTVGFVCWRKPAAARHTEVFTDTASKLRQHIVHGLWLGGGAVIFAIASAGGPEGTSLFTQAWRAVAAVGLGYAALRLAWQALIIGRNE